MRLVNVSHFYTGHAVLKNISWSAEKEKITAIIGKSGSGKSTFLQMFNGLIRPSSGEVDVLGHSLNYSELTSLRPKIGYMVQGTGLFPHLTIEVNISITGRITNIPNEAIQVRTDELMKLVGLPTSYKKKYPHQLSGGEQQRAGICRALFLDPPVLLMDEPLGALDPIIRKEVRDEIRKLQQLKPRTVLLVTHDVRDAKALADFILVLDNGTIQQYDTCENVLKHPVNTLVENLIEASI